MQFFSVIDLLFKRKSTINGSNDGSKTKQKLTEENWLNKDGAMELYGIQKIKLKIIFSLYNKSKNWWKLDQGYHFFLEGL